MINENIPKILFVDDEKNILNTLKRSFLKKPLKILTANSGQEALEILGKENIDIVVSDIKMPQMDGIEFLSKVKENYPEINRIILSGYVEKESVINAIITGTAFTYMTKPWVNEDLIAKLFYIINVKKMITNRNIVEIISKIKRLPTIPEIYDEFIDAVLKNASMKEISDIISKDISMSTKILQIINSAFYSQSNISSLETAVNLLGLNNLKNIIVQTILVDEKDYNLKERKEVLRISKTSYKVNKIIDKLYKIQYKEVLDDNYKSLGLLYDVGKLILIRGFSDDYFEILENTKKDNSIDFHEKELEHGFYGCTHRELGAYFLYLWNFSEINITAALYNFDIENLNEKEKKVIKTLHLADQFVKHYENNSLNVFYNSDLFNESNTSQENFNDLIDEIK